MILLEHLVAKCDTDKSQAVNKINYHSQPFISVKQEGSA